MRDFSKTGTNDNGQGANLDQTDSQIREITERVDCTCDEPIFCVLGMGRIGLPIALSIGERYQSIGFDAEPGRIRDLQRVHGRNARGSATTPQGAIHLHFTSLLEDLTSADIYVIATHMEQFDNATNIVSLVLAPGNVVVYASKSTARRLEEISIPQIETVAGMTCNRDFYVAYCGVEPHISGSNTKIFRHRIKGVRGTPEHVMWYLAQLQSAIPAAQTTPTI